MSSSTDHVQQARDLLDRMGIEGAQEASAEDLAELTALISAQQPAERGTDSKFSAFVSALTALCLAHGVTLTSSGYDQLQVWDADSTLGPLHFNGIEDHTKPNAGVHLDPTAR